MQPVTAVQRAIRVLVVDDSAVVRKMIRQVLENAGIEVVGQAPDPIVARDMLLELRPDVMTLDVEMPRLDGISFLKAVMAHQPMPVIVISSITPRGSEAALAALDAGAVDVLAKPSTAYSLSSLETVIVDRVRAAAKTIVRRGCRGRGAQAAERLADEVFPPGQILGVASSTGGTEALAQVIPRLPRTTPPIVFVQHIHPAFVESFAARLDGLSAVEVRVARAGETLREGQARIGAADQHLVVKRLASGAYQTTLRPGPKVCQSRPSADVLFHSLAEAAGPRAVGCVLTGMGDDGADGLLAMRRAGARTLAQDQASCVVFGMPREAHRRGAAEALLPLEGIAAALVAKLRQGPHR